MVCPAIRAIQARASSNYSHFNKIHHPSKSNPADHGTDLTNTDRALTTTRKLYEIASRLEDSLLVLQDCSDLLNDREASPNRRKEMGKIMRGIVVPLISETVDSVRTAAMSSAPMGGMPEVHRKLEVQRKIDAKDTHVKSFKKTSIEAVRIKMFLESRNNQKEKEEMSPCKKRARRPVVSPTRDLVSAEADICVPLPKVAGVYSKREAIEILSTTTKKKSMRRSSTMDKMISSGYAPTTVRYLQKLLKKREDGEIIVDDEWQSKGRKRLLPTSAVNSFVDGMKLGESNGARNIEHAIQKYQVNQIKESGFVPLVLNKKYSVQTIRNYTCEAANHGAVSLCQKAIAKSQSRKDAENSIRRVVGNLGMIGSTHFFPVIEEDIDIRNQLNDLPNENRFMYDYVTEIRGCPQYPVKPWLLFSTDDTKPYVFEGVVQTKNSVNIVTKDSIRKSGTLAVWRLDNGNSMRGMRVDMTFTMSAVGTCLPMVLTVSGLTEHELPGTDFMCVEVPGLCIGGNGINTDQVGYVLIMTNAPGAKKKRFRWYQDNILIPGVNAHRLKFDDFDAEFGASIPVEETAVCWCDGDIPQLSAITDSLELFAENRIIANKQHASASGAEQPADLAKVFKLLRVLLPHYTCAHLSVDECPIKKLVLEAFEDDILCGLKLSPTKKNSLVDFISVLPEVLGKCCTAVHVKHGFLENGTIDRQARRFPSWNGILATCKRNLPVDEYQMIVESFPKILQQYDSEGCAGDDFHATLGLPSSREEVVRDAGIRQEHMQRAKCINHPFVCELRNAEKSKARSSKLDQMKKDNEKHHEKVRANEEAVEILSKRLEDDGTIPVGSSLTDESNLEYCTLDTFDVLRAPLLKAFIIAHDNTLDKVSDIPNRGNLKAAQEGTVNSLVVAFRCKDKPNLLHGKAPFSAEEMAKYQDDVGEVNNEVDVTTIRLGQERDILPSKLLSDPLWKSNAVRLFNLENVQDIQSDVSQEAMDAADRLAKVLLDRMKKHLRRRVKVMSKRKHWSMRFARRNLPVVAAIMVLHDHLKVNLNNLDESDCLLAASTAKFTPCSAHPNREGTYLYFDTVRCRFVRSGKVIGRGFDKRNTEHKKGAESNTARSLFYRLFPSIISSRSSKRGVKGSFESLTQVIAAGFDRSNEVATYLDRDVDEGGLLLLTDNEKKNIRTSMKNLKCREITKFHHILAYQVELGYDLAISPDNNVSNSPGFESVLGVIGTE